MERRKKSQIISNKRLNTSNVMIEFSQSLKCVTGIMSIDGVIFYFLALCNMVVLHFEYLVGSCDW